MSAQVHINISAKLAQRIKEKAKITGLGRGEIIRLAISNGLKSIK